MVIDYGEGSKFLNSESFFDYSKAPNMKDNFLNSHSPDEANENQSLDPSNYLVAFSTNPQRYCVGLVDMVDSTKISASIRPEKISRYYQIFLNSMAKIHSSDS